MDYIKIKGAKQNNLKNIDINIPENQMTVITGVSGSGKSTLAYDVLFAEGQRRFLQSMSSSSRGFAINMMKPDVDLITGLTPVMSISQKKGSINPRSTVASIADLSNYIRLLFSTSDTPICPYCKKPIKKYTANQLTEFLINNANGEMIYVYSIISKSNLETYEELFSRLYSINIKEFLINDIKYNDEIDSTIINDGAKIEALIGKIRVGKENYSRMINIIENAYEIGYNFIDIKLDKNLGIYNCEDHIISNSFNHNDFSANDIHGSCPTCEGLGKHKITESWLLVKDENKTLRENPLYISQFSFIDHNGSARLYSLANHFHFSIDTPFKDLSDEVKNILFYGTNKEKYEILNYDGSHSTNQRYTSYEGLISYVDRIRKNKSFLSDSICDNIFRTIECPDCFGTGIRTERMFITINGKNIREIYDMSISDLKVFFENYNNFDNVNKQIIEEINEKLTMLEEIGLGYLSLGRRSDTLSGGEYQRIRLCAQLSSNLKGITYIIDEPTIGLHERDTNKILTILNKLKALGNTLVVVEHDIEIIKKADYLIELGPGAGEYGGNIIAKGTIKEIMNSNNSIIGEYLKDENKIKLPNKLREGNNQFLIVHNAYENNLKHIDVTIPLEKFICITGVSGSGKSTFVNEVLYKGIAKELFDKRMASGKYSSIEGINHLKDIRYIDQSPIGKSTRSNIATFIGIYDDIRELFASTNVAKEKNFNSSFFSFNVKGGRCENCFGEGVVTSELKFMQDVTSVCPVCNGKKFKQEILEMKFNNKNIYEVLNLTVIEAIDFFKNYEKIDYKIIMLNKLGLSYLRLGQSTSTISGGEAERLKLAKELAKKKVEKNVLYILDEPTIGLHLKDIEQLLKCINEIVDNNNTMIVIEHNIEFIKTADYIIDFGLEAGNDGGSIIACGKPKEISQSLISFTGKYLKKYYDK